MAIESGMETAASRNWRGTIWITVLVILLVPAVAMQFTAEVNWGPGDFAIAAGLLGIGALALDLIIRHARARIALAAAVLAAMLVVWAELAVGILH